VNAPAAVRALAAPPDAVSVEVFSSFEEAEPAWRALEREGIASPYQRFDWVEAVLGEAGAERAVVLLRRGDGEPLMLLPLAIRRRAGLRVASVPGGKHANFQLPLLSREAALGLTPASAERCLVEACRLLDVDALAAANAPRAWRGVANPLVAPGRARRNPSDAYMRALDPDPEATLALAFGRETRKKLRKKERLLSERGAVSFGAVAVEDEVDPVLDAFFAQKAARMQALGIVDAFGDGETRSFLRRACRAGLGAGAPAVELYALRLDGRVIATFGGAGDDERLCGMFNSFDGSPGLERCSPGEVLLSRLIRLQCERGRRSFDLGVGEARYKSALCDEVEELFDVLIPATARGAALAAVNAPYVALKRAIKRNARVWSLVEAARRGTRRVPRKAA